MIAIIPARSGSKRIPGKNIKPFLGHPIIAYAVQSAIKSGLFESVIVSTDSDEIAAIARNYGAEVPFLRSASASSDTATTTEALMEVIENLAKIGRHYKWLACIYPTAATISAQTLVRAWKELEISNSDSLMSVVRYGHPIQRALKVVGSSIKYVSPEFKNVRTQDLEATFHDAGQFYFSFVDSMASSGSFITAQCCPFEITELECQDIDNEIDWSLAELKAKLFGLKL